MSSAFGFRQMEVQSGGNCSDGVTFDLGFSPDDSSGGYAASLIVIPEEPLPVIEETICKPVKKTNVVKPRIRSFNAPLPEDELDTLSNKQFTAEMHKKLCWAVNMFNDWHTRRNLDPESVFISADLNDVQSLTKINLSFALVRFMSEVKKLNGDDFPPKSLYKIIK